MNVEAEAEVTVRVVDDVRFVQVTGAFDAEDAPILAQALALPADDGTSGTVTDLAEVTFADSSFLHTLLAAQNEHERTGVPLVFAEVPPVVRRLLDLTDVTRILTLADDVPAAVELLRTRGDRPRPQ
ncbi:STAS domain-containing protein [Streptomyces sp. NPDC000345]|uniref:STAS domain-containing protein n=1 Tax=Streptomyces sp. NPDC000345 TaxID=3364537 RepID=UPI00367674C5